MKKNKELNIRESRLTYLINQLKNKLDTEEDLNSAYNRLLVERAVIRKKLEHKKSKNVLTTFCEKLNRMNLKPSSKENNNSSFLLPLINLKKPEKLICDYFKS